MYQVTNTKTGATKQYATARAAYRAADRMDNAYGAAICTIKPI
jgi:hypothetical protein